MTPVKNNNPKNGIRPYIPVVVAIIGAFGGGVGANYLLVSNVAPDLQTLARPDPFTGAQGQAIEKRLSDLERRVDQLPPRELELAVQILRHDLNEIHRRIEKLEK